MSVGSVTGINELIVDNVQGEFELNIAKPLQYVSPSSGITTIVASGTGNDITVSDFELTESSC